ncbi:hypothetical protein PMF13cell1_00665 [Blautia producta]|uniref:Cyclic lactone autoinducer peptide n=1 Tax=Blautia producta TaxID=33035 RepID=A0A4P6LTG6_9FIRM|nr:cyclic lactone autoinducer peptide [Blautia producta]QBE95162.1 hypothetical protein PMF13cell1_00665 [Blautia producta]
MREKLYKKIVDVINRVAVCFVTRSANLACDWLYYQDEEPDAVKKFRRF